MSPSPAGNSHDWDLAAADLLVHEAGGVLTALDGQPLIYNRPDPVHGALIAAGRERHAALVDLVRAQASRARREPRPTPRMPKDRAMARQAPRKQLLHLVFGGELSGSTRPSSRISTSSTSSASIRTTPTAYAAWKAKAQQTVDNAQMRYFIVHLHRLLDPDSTGAQPAAR